MTTKRFNLIDEPWIPIADRGNVSLRQAFSEPLPPSPGGSPLIKITIFKFLLAVAQAACTPADDDAWIDLRPEGLGEQATAYLQKHYDAFFLYGDHPFLQFKACEEAQLKPYGTVMPEVASGNTSWLSHQQLEPALSDADKSLLLLEQMSLCLGGKKPYNKLVLTPGYEKKASGRPGPAVCFAGLLHSFLLGDSLLETLWLNLLTQEDIEGQRQWEHGLGVPPWERMPQGEDCPVAQALKTSLMGRLVPLARFCLLDDNGLRFTEGIVHPDYLSGMTDPSAAVDASKSKPRILRVDPEKRPWRQLPALLSFLDAQENRAGFYCLGLQTGLNRVKTYRNICGIENVGVWSGGVKVSSQAGEQYLTGKDDELESEYRIRTDKLRGSWFRAFSALMEEVEKRAQTLYSAVYKYGKDMKLDDKSAGGEAAEAAGLFWQMAEPDLPEIIAGCEDKKARASLIGRWYGTMLMLYDNACPHDTGRQVEEWCKHRPLFREDTPMKNVECRYAEFLAWIADRLGPTPRVRDTGAVARLKRADSSERLAVQSWELLIRHGVADEDFAPCIAVFAPLCRRDDPKDGKASLGRALVSCFENKDQGSSRLRRLLNCNDQDQLCRLLRPLLAFIDSRAREKLSYFRLLQEVLTFRSPVMREDIKRRWAEGYWRESGGEKTENSGDKA